MEMILRKLYSILSSPVLIKVRTKVTTAMEVKQLHLFIATACAIIFPILYFSRAVPQKSFLFMMTSVKAAMSAAGWKIRVMTILGLFTMEA